MLFIYMMYISLSLRDLKFTTPAERDPLSSCRPVSRQVKCCTLLAGRQTDECRREMYCGLNKRHCKSVTWQLLCKLLVIN